MIVAPKPITILMVDDNPDDRFLLKETFQENCLSSHLETVKDGEELMDFLHHCRQYADSTVIPSLILLDLHLPKKSGLEVLQEIKEDEKLR